MLKYLDNEKLNGSSIEELICKPMENLPSKHLDPETSQLYFNIARLDNRKNAEETMPIELKESFAYRLCKASQDRFQYRLTPCAIFLVAFILGDQTPGRIIMYMTYIQYRLKVAGYPLDTLVNIQILALLRVEKKDNNDLSTIWYSTKVKDLGCSDNLIDYRKYGESIKL